MKEELFRDYWKKGPIPVMPREKFDTIEQYVEYLKHLAAYALFTKEFVAGKKVLEIGCGTGYGADYLSKSASNIVAIDIREGGISYCQDKYGKDNLIFMQADGLKLPFKNESFDVVLSFQVIEHIEPKMVLNYLSEIKRVLKRDGVFLISTPNSRLRLLPFQKPWNPEHVKEYNDEELKKLLSEVFEEVKVYGLYGSDEIQAIECNRVKQSPLKVYVINPLYRVLDYLLPSPILIQLKRVGKIFKSEGEQNPIPQETFLTTFSINGFRIDPACSKDCLDLYGICTKTAAQ